MAVSRAETDTGRRAEALLVRAGPCLTLGLSSDGGSFCRMAQKRKNGRLDKKGRAVREIYLRTLSEAPSRERGRRLSLSGVWLPEAKVTVGELYENLREVDEGSSAVVLKESGASKGDEGDPF